MRHKTSLLFMVSLLALALPLIYPVTAGAEPGQYYFGDGGVPNYTTIPPGGWTYDKLFNCLGCHNPNKVGGAPDMSTYLMTGHKNMLRMTGFNEPRTGPDGKPYATDANGYSILWGTASTNYTALKVPTIDEGTCTVAGFFTSVTCANAGGTWTPNLLPLFYIYDGWLNESAANVFTPTALAGSSTAPGSYTCGRCHTTGFTMDTSLQTARAPEFIYPGITNIPGRPGYVNFDPDGGGPSVASSWAIGSYYDPLDGVQCERCHDATNHSPDGNPGATVVTGAAATALCLQCHRQEHTITYTSGQPLGSNIVPTPFTDNPAPANPPSEPLYPLPQLEVGSNGSYAPAFYGHSTGTEYLNSVHGQYTGNFQNISDPTQYTSYFVSEGGVSGNGCTTCHEVHQSIVPAVDAAAPIKNECTSCHAAYGTYISNIKHPTGPGTPLGDLSDIPGACETCHMPKTNNGEGLNAHLWRISVDSNYSTFPTQAQWNAGQKTAFTAPTGSFTQAVWVDLDLACGQCHGGSGTNKPGIEYFTKSLLSTYANNMHNAIPIVRITWGNDSVTSFKVNFDASNSTCPLGATCNYSWTFGDGQTGSGKTVSHTYANGTSQTVTLTIDTNGTYYTEASASQIVTPTVVNQPPTAAGLAGATVNGLVVSFTDASTDNSLNSPNGFATGAVTVNWKDGTISTGNQGGFFQHPYAGPGTFNILHTVKDLAGLSTSETKSVSVAPVSYSITVNTGISGVLYALKYNGTTKQAGTDTKGAGSWTFNSVTSGSYTVTVYLNKEIFTCPNETTATSSGTTFPVTVGPNQNITCTYASSSSLKNSSIKKSTAGQ